MYDDILQTIGNTPMVRINKLNPNKNTNIYAKLEGLNPSGSIKDRIALSMLQQAEISGNLIKGKTIIEPTSGNTGVALAMIGLLKGYDVEIYVQDISEKHLSSGVYSILNDNWVIEPQKGKKGIDVRKILEKGEEYAKIIDELIKKKEKDDNVKSEVDDVKRKIKRFRQTGLEDGGEYSYENLTFKLLRRNGYIEKLINLKN